MAMLMVLMASERGGPALQFLDLYLVQTDRETLSCVIEPRPLFSLKDMQIPHFPFPADLAQTVFDGPLQQCVSYLSDVDAMIELSEVPSVYPLRLIKLTFNLEVRNLAGMVIENHEHDVYLGITNQLHHMFVQAGDSFEVFDLRQLHRQAQQRCMLLALVQPAQSAPLKLPDDSRFVVELLYNQPQLLKSKRQRRVAEVQPFILAQESQRTSQATSLGIAFVSRSQARLTQQTSVQSHILADAAREFARLFGEHGHLERRERVQKLHSYLNKMPVNAFAWGQLVTAQMEADQLQAAWDKLQLVQPLVSGLKEYGELPDQLATRLEQHRQHLFERRSGYPTVHSESLAIIEPVSRDTVAAESHLTFTYSGNQQPFHADVFLNGKLAGSSAAPPFCIPYRTQDQLGVLDLDLIVYFTNHTKQVLTTQIRSIYLGGRGSVHRAQIRAVVTRNAQTIVSDLQARDFHISEDGQPCELLDFKQNVQPINVAILLDTSSSMAGQKVAKAQYAVMRFLDKLEPSDSAAIYSVDHNVIKLSDFTHDFRATLPAIYTITPRSSTSLYDALLVASNDLMVQAGTKVIIVVSDGIDNGSHTSREQILRRLSQSPIQVYAVFLPASDYFEGRSNPGRLFLESMADLTGSVFLEVREATQLDATFTRIYKALKSFYTIDFYVQSGDLNSNKIQVLVKRLGAKAHFKPFLSHGLGNPLQGSRVLCH